MISTKEIKGSKEQIAEQIRATPGHIISALLVLDQEAETAPDQLTDAEVLKIMAEMDADAVSVPRADDSREAIYTRMPGE